MSDPSKPAAWIERAEEDYLDPTVEDAREAMEIANSVRQFARRRLSSD